MENINQESQSFESRLRQALSAAKGSRGKEVLVKKWIGVERRHGGVGYLCEKDFNSFHEALRWAELQMKKDYEAEYRIVKMRTSTVTEFMKVDRYTEEEEG